jgi:hypothetical protein
MALKYVSTLLTPSDVAIFSGAVFFNAPALLPTAGNAPVLMATGDSGSAYLGCTVIPFADEQAGTLVRNSNNLPASILTIRTLAGHFGGACAWDRGITATGILIDDLDPLDASPFRVLATGKSF